MILDPRELLAIRGEFVKGLPTSGKVFRVRVGNALASNFPMKLGFPAMKNRNGFEHYFEPPAHLEDNEVRLNLGKIFLPRNENVLLQKISLAESSWLRNIFEDLHTPRSVTINDNPEVQVEIGGDVTNRYGYLKNGRRTMRDRVQIEHPYNITNDEECADVTYRWPAPESKIESLAIAIIQAISLLRHLQSHDVARLLPRLRLQVDHARAEPPDRRDHVRHARVAEEHHEDRRVPDRQDAPPAPGQLEHHGAVGKVEVGQGLEQAAGAARVPAEERRAVRRESHRSNPVRN